MVDESKAYQGRVVREQDAIEVLDILSNIYEILYLRLDRGIAITRRSPFFPMALT